MPWLDLRNRAGVENAVGRERDVSSTKQSSFAFINFGITSGFKIVQLTLTLKFVLIKPPSKTGFYCYN